MFSDQTITSGNRYPKWARLPLLFGGGNEQTFKCQIYQLLFLQKYAPMLIIVKTVKLCNPKVNFKRVRRDMCWCSLLIRSFPGKQ